MIFFLNYFLITPSKIFFYIRKGKNFEPKGQSIFINEVNILDFIQQTIVKRKIDIDKKILFFIFVI